MSSTLRFVAIIAALALTVAGTVHLVEAPGAYREAAYLGLSFVAHFAVAVLAAAGILLGSRLAWALGALVSAATIVLYVISRTVGLPGQSGEPWFGWAGVLSGAAEVIALVAALWGLRLMRKTATGAVGPPTR
jgi:hypothetical protein